MFTWIWRLVEGDQALMIYLLVTMQRMMFSQPMRARFFTMAGTIMSRLLKTM